MSIQCNQCNNLFNDCLDLYFHKKDYCPNSHYCSHCETNLDHLNFSNYILNQLIGDPPTDHPPVGKPSMGNSIANFLNEEIDISKDPNNYGLALIDIWNKYLQHIDEGFYPSKKLFKEHLLKRYGHLVPDRNRGGVHKRNVFTTIKWTIHK